MKIVCLASAASVLAAGCFGRNGAGLSSLADKIEEGIYQQEAKGDLDAAISAFREVLEAEKVADALAAEAMFRIAQCYSAQGQEDLALKTFREIAEAYPEQRKWVVAATESLPKPFEPRRYDPVSGERDYYEWSLPNGSVAGRSVATTRIREDEGRRIVRFEARLRLSGDHYSILDHDADTLRPISLEWKNANMGSLQCSYAEDGLSATVYYKNNDTKRDFVFDDPVYENDQFYALLRYMPLEKGYVTELPLFFPMSGIVNKVRVTVQDVVDVESQAGTKPCFKVRLDIGGTTPQLFYVTTDEGRQLIRLEVGGVSGVLAEEVIVPDFGRVDFVDDEYGFEFSHPSSWSVVQGPEGRRQKVIFEPYAKARLELNIGDAVEVDPGDADTFLEEATARLRKNPRNDFLPDAQLLKGVNLPAVEFEGDTTGRAGEPVELYGAWLFGERAFYEFKFVFSEGSREELMPQLEAVIRSFSEH